MSLFSKGLAVVFLALSACGFTPAYGPGSTGAALNGQIAFAEPTDRSSFELVQRLEERFGRSVDPRYDLGVSLSTRRETLAVAEDGDADRYTLLGTADYTLTDRTTGAPVFSGQVTNFTGYSETGTTVSSLSAERDAKTRLVIILADMVHDRLIAIDL